MPCVPVPAVVAADLTASVSVSLIVTSATTRNPMRRTAVTAADIGGDGTHVALILYSGCVPSPTPLGHHSMTAAAMAFSCSDNLLLPAGIVTGPVETVSLPFHPPVTVRIPLAPPTGAQRCVVTLTLKPP